MNVLIEIAVSILKLLIPALIQQSKDSFVVAAPQYKTTSILHKRIEAVWKERGRHKN